MNSGGVYRAEDTLELVVVDENPTSILGRQTKSFPGVSREIIEGEKVRGRDVCMAEGCGKFRAQRDIGSGNIKKWNVKWSEGILGVRRI